MIVPSAAPVAVLLGGGIESTALVVRFLAAGNSVIPVHVNCGLIWDECESRYVKKFLESHAAPAFGIVRETGFREGEAPAEPRTADRHGSAGASPSHYSDSLLQALVEIRLPLVDFLGSHWAVTGMGVPRAGDSATSLEIPLRNLTLLSFAVHRLNLRPAVTLALGTTADNCYRDGSRTYFDKCEELLSLETGRPVTILTPLIQLTKTQVIRESDGRTLAMSFSCVSPRDGRHCGDCIKCGRRRESFRAAGVPDPTLYSG